ncbi:hypothetical protein ACEQ8H_000375 [Pleosporales sp. CAS-2024a]
MYSIAKDKRLKPAVPSQDRADTPTNPDTSTQDNTCPPCVTTATPIATAHLDAQNDDFTNSTELRNLMCATLDAKLAQMEALLERKVAAASDKEMIKELEMKLKVSEKENEAYKVEVERLKSVIQMLVE